MPTLHLKTGEAAIFGYGSLLSLPSFERTYGRPYTAARHIANLPGWRRTWSLLSPNRNFYFEASAGGRCYPDHIVYLNIERSDTVLNGILYLMTESDVAEFDRRETAYDRLDITTQLRGIEVQNGRAYVYVGKPECVARTLGGPEHAGVRQTYIDIVDSGLLDFGPEFTAAYDHSTDKPPAANIIADLRDDSPSR